MEEMTSIGVKETNGMIPLHMENVTEEGYAYGSKIYTIAFKEYDGCYMKVIMGDIINGSSDYGKNFMVDDILAMMMIANTKCHNYALIDQIFVTPELRGRNVARNMIEEFIEKECTDDRILFATAHLLKKEYPTEPPKDVFYTELGKICGWLEYMNFVSTNSFNDFEGSEGYVFRNQNSKDLIRYLNISRWRDKANIERD